MSVEEITAFPLYWPPARARVPESARTRANFSKNGERLSIAAGRDRIIAELTTMRAQDVVISTNVPAKRDGTPYASAAEPRDPGVAVYFKWKEHPHCMACDKWDRLADNMAAIAKHLDAMRGQLRWGVADTATLFAGFKALPPGPLWWKTLGVDRGAPLHVIKQKYLAEMERTHPDKGGKEHEAAMVTWAWGEAKREKEQTNAAG